VSLISRHLEANGMPTVIVGSALDIVEYCAVPRFLFVDFPLGNPCGKPWHRDMQLRIVRQALSMFESATHAMTTERSPEQWGDDSWRARYMEVTADNRSALAQMGEDLRHRRQRRRPRPELQR
jgi:D-proline reductase (dithiol) PrdB